MRIQQVIDKKLIKWKYRHYFRTPSSQDPYRQWSYCNIANLNTSGKIDDGGEMCKWCERTLKYYKRYYPKITIKKYTQLDHILFGK